MSSFSIFSRHSRGSFCPISNVTSRLFRSTALTSAQLHDDPKQPWRNRTRRIIEAGALSNSISLNESVELMRYWSKQHSLEGTDSAWKLIHQMVRYECTKRPTLSTITTEAINGFLHGWALAGSSTLEPKAILQQLRYFQSVLPSFVINCQAYNIILDVAIRQRRNDAHILADDILNQLQSGPVQPDAILFNTAIHAHAKFGSHISAQAVFQNMTVPPDQATYGSLLSAYANHGQPQEAEQLLLLIEHPNTHHLNAVLHAWAKAKQPDRCYQIFRHLQTLRMKSINITSVCFGTVISAFSTQGRAREAEQLLQELFHLHQDTQHPDLLPSIVECNSVIVAWARSGQSDAVERATAILQRIEELSLGNPALRPGVETYTALLHAHAQSARRDAGEQALIILQRMWDLVKAGSPHMKPDVTCYNTVLDCLAKSGTQQDADQAEEILQSMHERCRQGDTNLFPNSVSYASVINALSRSGAKDAPQRAERLLEELNHFSTTMDMSCSRVAYNAVLTVWARSDDPNASRRAEALVVKMKMMQQNGQNTNGGPDMFTYNALLQTYAINQEAEKADALLQTLCNDYLERKGSVKVDIIAFNTVISAWSRQRDNDAAMRAEEVFQTLERVHNELGIRPDTVTYTSRISAWSSSSDPWASQRVLSILSDMQRKFKAGDMLCKPNAITFNWGLTAISKKRNGDTLPDAYSIMDMMYAMNKDGHCDCKPTLNTYGIFLKCIARSHSFDKAKRAFEILSDMKNHSVHPDLRSFNEVLAACAYSTRFPINIRMEAFGIALATFQWICKVSEPSPESFSFFFQAASGLDMKKEIEKVYHLCCQLGHERNSYVVRDLQKAAPGILFQNKRE